MNFFKKFTPILLALLMVSGAVLAQKNKTPNVTSKDVSKKELKNFVQAVTTIQTTRRAMRTKIQKIIKDEGLSTQRFRMIMASKQNPKIADTLDVSKKEQKSYKKIEPKMKKMNQKMAQKYKTAIKANGLTQQRFQAILAAMRTDKDLQQRFQKIKAKQMNIKSNSDGDSSR